MIPLILLALGLGAALTVYEFSPRTRSRVDTYVRAIRSANASHQTADAHLVNANVVAVTAARHAQQANAARQTWSPSAPPPMQWAPMPIPVQPIPPPTPAQPPLMVPATTLEPEPTSYAPEPEPYTPEPEPLPVPDVVDAQANAQANAAQVATDAAVDHAAQAIEANQDAAKNTAEAAQNAQTEAQRQEAARSAARVLEREKKIAAALSSLGIGQCGVRSYSPVTERVKNALLAKLRSEGMVVTGDNPWNIVTHQYDVKLRAVWDPEASVVKLIVTAGKGGLFGLVTCDEIWKKIDPIMHGVIG